MEAVREFLGLWVDGRMYVSEIHRTPSNVEGWIAIWTLSCLSRSGITISRHWPALVVPLLWNATAALWTS